MTASWIADAEIFARWLDRGTDDAIGLDTEFMRRDSFHPKLALVQLAMAGQCALIDPLAFDASPGLRTLVANRVCVMHSASEDMEALAPLLGDASLRLYDTQIAAAFCGLGFGLSYRNLVGALLDIEIAKDETRSDWLRRPLSDNQIAYAEQDVAHLHALHALLRERLAQRGHIHWHEEDCARMAARLHRGEADPQPQRAFRSAAAWPLPRQALLRRLLLWRESTARMLDRPRPWLLDDATALSLASDPPASANALLERTRGLRALRSSPRAELLDLLRSPVRDEDTRQTEPILAAPSGRAKLVVAAMKARVDAIAARLDLPSGLLCPRRLLEEYAVTRTWPDALQGWRHAVLEPELAPLLA